MKIILAIIIVVWVFSRFVKAMLPTEPPPTYSPYTKTEDTQENVK